jgi:peptidylprolyl isomerase
MERSTWLRDVKLNRSCIGMLIVVHLALSACSDGGTVAPQANREILIEDKVQGTGSPTQAGDTVLFHYVGFISATGQVFDNSYERGLPLEVIAGEKGKDKQSAVIKNNRENGSVVTGLARGLVGVRIGGRRIISVPKELAYGGCDNAPQNVPTLVCLAEYLEFEVTVLSIRF